MIEFVLFVWAWLYTATAIEAQAVQMMAKTAPPPRKKICCNYLMKEEEINVGGVICGEEKGVESRSG